MSESSKKSKSKTKLFFKNLPEFLESCKITDKENKDVSHTKLGSQTINEYSAKYKVQDKHKDFFYKIYKEWVFTHKMETYLTEKHHPDFSPVLIDLDFRYEMDEKDKISSPIKEEEDFSSDEEEDTPLQTEWNRKYTPNNIIKFLELYFEILDNILDIPEENKVAYIMEKPSPIYDKDKNVMKDGVHIIMPYIVCGYAPLNYARRTIIQNQKVISLFSKLGFTNPVDDIVDEAVIQRNNWFMYGSRKPEKEPYLVTSIIKWDSKNNQLKLGKTPSSKSNGKLVKLFSVYDYQKDKICPVKNPKLIEMDLKKIEEKKYKPKMKKKMVKNKTLEDLKVIEKLVSILDDSRAEKYDDWIRLGWCLHNIDFSLFDVWDEFSQRSPKYKEGICEEFWESMVNNGLELGSLHRWAKKDSPREYKKIIREDLTNLIKASLNQTDYDIAKVVHRMLKHEFVCVSSKSQLWYQFKNHRWIEIDNATELRRKISEDISKEYTNLALHCNSQLIGSIDDDQYDEMVNQRETLERRIVVANKLALKLKNESFKKNIVSACATLFHDPKFLEKLDSNVDLIGFENGVYDLQRSEFREGYPEDYISFSTKINYEEMNDDNPIVTQVHEFLAQVLPIDAVKDYVLKILGSVLSGKTGQEKFHIWTGCHAKGTKILMADGYSELVENLKVGDLVMGPDSKPRTLQNLVHGKSPMYQIRTSSHKSFTVNELHILSLQAVSPIELTETQNGKFIVVKWHEKDIFNLPVIRQYQVAVRDNNPKLTKKTLYQKWKLESQKNTNMISKGYIVDIPLKEYLSRLDIMGNGKYRLYSKSVDFQKQKLLIEPYLLGHIIFSEKCTQIKVNNNRVQNYLDKFVDINVITKKNIDNTHWINTIKNDLNEDSLYKNITSMRLINNQYIPIEYLLNNKENRLKLLSGIIDAKAIYQKKKNRYYLKNLDSKLLKDMEFLVRSLGCRTLVRKTNPNFTLYFQAPKELTLPVLNSSKVDNNSKEFAWQNYKFNVKKVADSQYYGFTVDKDHLYLTDDFLVHHNCGGNGKSKIIELFELAFGDYCGKLSVTNVTQKRPASNACTPELLKNKGKRFVTLQEPDDDEQIHVGAMKELTGGDKIQTRGLHKDPIEFKPQWKIVMTSNVLPNVSANDNGTWRRIRVTEFISRFMERKDMKPGKKYQFPIDYDLSTKLQQWPEAFMYILIQNYHNFIKNGLVEPQEVLKNTEAYKEESDCILQFINECLEEEPGEKIKLEDTYMVFKEWYKNSGNSNKLPNRKDFKTNVSNVFGNLDSKNHWRGVTFVNENEDDDDDEDLDED